MNSNFQLEFTTLIREIYASTDPQPLLLKAAQNLQRYQKQITDVTTPYEKRLVLKISQTSAIQLTKAKQAKFPPKKFTFSSRKFLSTVKTEIIDQKDIILELNSIYNLQNQTVQVHDEITKIRNCEKCEFQFDLSLRKTIFIFGCKSCKFVGFDVSGAVFLEKLLGCEIAGKCHQLRITDCCELGVRVDVNGPVIENSTKISFFKPETCQDGWNDVKDFSWLRAEQNPNWRSFE